MRYLAALGLLLFASGGAYAGSYVCTSITGGTYAATPKGTSGSYTGTATSYGGGSHSTGPNASATASGQITATFTWSPSAANDQPPTQVVVEQTSTASFEGTSALTPTGSADNGLGAPDNTTYTPQTGDNDLTGSSSSTKWSLQSGGSTVTITCSPSASAKGSLYAQASVSYAVSVFPIQIQFSGTTVDSSGNQDLLIGQGCNATISAGPTTLSNYSWVIPGNIASGFTDGHTGGYSTATDLSSSNPHWYWLDAGGIAGGYKTESVTAQVTITDQLGESLGSVNLSANVNVYAPLAAFTLAPSGNQSSYDVDNGVVDGVGSDVQYTVSTSTASPWIANYGTLMAIKLSNVLHQFHSSVGWGGETTQNKYNNLSAGPFRTTNGLVLQYDDQLDHQIGNDFDQIMITDYFYSYVMFTPGGNDSIPVPLTEVDYGWSVNATGTVSSDNWSANPGESSIQYYGTVRPNPYAVNWSDSQWYVL